LLQFTPAHKLYITLTPILNFGVNNSKVHPSLLFRARFLLLPLQASLMFACKPSPKGAPVLFVLFLPRTTTLAYLPRVSGAKHFFYVTDFPGKYTVTSLNILVKCLWRGEQAYKGQSSLFDNSYEL
jgi:hypothetical protein